MILVLQYCVYPSFSFAGKIKAMNSGRKDLLKFLMLVGDLKHIPRTGNMTVSMNSRLVNKNQL